MNYLAHILLSNDNIDYRLGNILADKLKGRPWKNCSEDVRQGMLMHKKIDSFTDAHSSFLSARDCLVDGYLRGVVVDIVFDHFLSKHWDKYVNISLDDFIRQFCFEANKKNVGLPVKVDEFINHIINDNVLRQYLLFDELIEVFCRVDCRLSDKLRARETVSEHFPVVAANYNEIEQNFLSFFPDLIEMFFKERNPAKIQIPQNDIGLYLLNKRVY